ncbi:hypothetical protein SUGI_0230110 [Cryptomeria japonica]|uniref:LOB domain-containing protein 1 n=1 Tax=Cryptomeria japonica TaxID=3369 RepID=UPI002408C900|nr:LOB domain-containing protein 1 [Cryptomeria japonica]GLJ14290.1 hypothetical protein SUGI_0230110 [Cryptomeria japonica]
MEQKAKEICGIVYPCAPCRIQRKKCGDNCPLAPYFPPNDPQKFLLVHSLFGTSKIVKILKDIPVEKREDTVNSLVFEASARKYDPIYGSSGAVCRLQKKVIELQSQLENTQAELLNTQANLVRHMSGSEAGTTLDFTQDLVQRSDDFILLQDDQDLFWWEDMMSF